MDPLWAQFSQAYEFICGFSFFITFELLVNFIFSTIQPSSNIIVV